MTSLELLQGIELWLSVKREPSKKEVEEYLIEIRKHIEEALAISRVVGQSEQLPCGDLIKHNFSLSKIGRCITCDRETDKAR